MDNTLAPWIGFTLIVGITVFSASRAAGGETVEVDLDAGPWARAVFAGGCFWCMEPPFEKIDGVRAVISGYTGGDEEHPAYRDVASGKTGHTEAVLVEYDPDAVTYEELLDVFWQNIDPTQHNGQFVDIGTQYRTGIYYLDEEQRRLAEASRQALVKSGHFRGPIATEITQATRFWRAEEYHQDFYKKDPGRYYPYRRASGRDAFIQRHWSKKKSR